MQTPRLDSMPTLERNVPAAPDVRPRVSRKIAELMFAIHLTEKQLHILDEQPGDLTAQEILKMQEQYQRYLRVYERDKDTIWR